MPKQATDRDPYLDGIMKRSEATLSESGEMVDAVDLKSAGETHAGSTPAYRTNQMYLAGVADERARCVKFIKQAAAKASAYRLAERIAEAIEAGDHVRYVE